MASRLFPLLTLLLLLPALGQASLSSVVLSSTIVMPGQTLRVEVDQWPTGTALNVVWKKKVYRLYPVGTDSMRALIGIPLGVVPGNYPMTFQLGRKSAALALPEALTVTIATRTFPIDNIQFPPSKTRIFNESLERREGAKIHKVLLGARSMS